ncbi:unnamed protein product [Anisakis simplex]|uniref:Amiloride-sensitive sodium channel n=1 Tax=Anisakis simplex TaxID=6269 RepID=A0A0M3JR59_ANISI|nr:unnamed protein product [Anisakis simplex]
MRIITDIKAFINTKKSTALFDNCSMPRRRKHTDDVITASSTSIESLEPTLNRFAEDTSMLGFRYLHTRYKTWFRCVWALVLIFFIGLTIYQVIERIGYYFIRNPIITTRAYYTPSRIAFPTVLVCNKMQLKSSKIAKLHPNLLRTMSLMYEDDGTLTRNESVWRMIESFDRIVLSNAYSNAFQTVDDFFMSCQYGKGLMCSDNIQTVLTPNGVCFAVKNNLTVERPGPETTLSLLLNLEVYEIIPGWVSEPGVMVSMYDPSVPPSGYLGEGMHLEPGKVVTIPINDMRKLRRHSSECGRQQVGNFNRSEYSHVGCQWYAANNNIEQACRCVSMRSPRHRQTLFSETSQVEEQKLNSGIEQKAHKDGVASFPACNLKQEFSCVNNILAKPFDEKTSAEREQCPEDCTEVSFTTIVFGNRLDVNEIASFLPGDWEEEKEKRLTNFQNAFDNLPNHRIPLVRNIQKLATEAQSFLEQALKTFGITENITETHLPCIMDQQHDLATTIVHFHDIEHIWEHVASYIELIFQFHLGSLFKLLHIDITADFSLYFDNKYRDDEDNKTDSKIKEIESAIFDLQLIESSINQPKSVFGLKSLNFDERKAVISKIITSVKELQECLIEMRNDLANISEYRRQCVQIFKDHYNALRDARLVSQLLSTNLFTSYESPMKKLIETLKHVKYQTQPKMFEWKNFDISLRQFETLYSEGGKDSHEIHDLLKMRKILQSDLIREVRFSKHFFTYDPFQEGRLTMINELLISFNSALMARQNFLNFTQLQPLANSSEYQIQRSIQCLHTLLTCTQTLKKSNFLRAEWLSRLQRQVTIAKSYSPSPQYDEINLLFVKIYFAHFKQEVITQERSYSLFLLLAEIGGTIGLYVGATLLTVAETIVFFIEKRTRKLLIMPTDL